MESEQEIKTRWASKKERVRARANYTIELNKKIEALANEAITIKTLRDEIAIAAMQGILVSSGEERTYADVAVIAYKQADAMFKQREIKE